MSPGLRFIGLMALLGGLFWACSPSQESSSTGTDPSSVAGSSSGNVQRLRERAARIHDRVMVMDTHVDIDTANFTARRNYTQALDTQVNLPNMEEGGMDAAWFVVYTPQGPLSESGYADAYANAIDKFNAIHRLTERIAPERIELAYSSADVRRILDAGRKAAMIGVENAYALGTDLDNIAAFQDMGARYMSLTHEGHNQFADSNTGDAEGQWRHDGLSELGREAVAEMNRWGIMIDVSHPSRASNLQAIELSRAPVIASHSSARALNDVSRNLSDEELRAIADSGGVVQVVAFSSYLDTAKYEAHQQAVRRLHQEIADELGMGPLPDEQAVEAMNAAERAAHERRMARIESIAESRMDTVNEQAPPVDVADLIDHVDYIAELVGVDHVGLSGDFDGGGGVHGWQDASESFNVTRELVRRGYTEQEIAGIWGENVLRVLDEVQAVAARIRSGE